MGINYLGTNRSGLFCDQNRNQTVRELIKLNILNKDKIIDTQIRVEEQGKEFLDNQRSFKRFCIFMVFLINEIMSDLLIQEI